MAGAPVVVPAVTREGIPRWWPARWYYGWALVGTLGLTATVSYGILSYALTAFIVPMSAELGWSKTQITGAFSLAQLVAGLAAIPVGRWVDRHGARALMTGGAALAATLLVAWAHVETLAGFYAIFALMGMALAAVLYEPAFAVLATWFRRDRSRALTVLTFLGGFASVIFVPVATTLVARIGWRPALLWFVAIYVVLVVVPHAIALRRRPADLGLRPDGGAADDVRTAPSGMRPSRETSVPAREAVRGRSFRWLTVGFALSAIATTAMTVHLVPLLVERGHGIGFAGAAMGLLGLMALPGRLVFTPLGDRFSRSTVTASIFAIEAVAAVVFLTSRGTWAVWTFVVLYGAGFGAITPARAALLAELYGAADYGKISGVLALVLSVARATAPVGASVLYAVAGGPARGYDAVLVALVILCIGSTAAVLLAGDRHAAPEVPVDIRLAGRA
jgi:MFS family permease